MLRREVTRIELKPEDREEFQRLQSRKGSLPFDSTALNKVLSRQLQWKALPCCTPSLLPQFRKSLLSQRFVLRAAGSANGNEVEIKLRLRDEAAHEKVAQTLQPQLVTTHKQENIFFDGSEKELSRQRIIVRTRFYNTDQRCLLTVKGQQVLKDGIGRGTEVEEDIDPKEARKYLMDPGSLYSLESDVLQPILRKHKVSGLKCLGGFRNERSDYHWEGFKLELDKTMFPHGTVYEVEVETEDPDALKAKLEGFMKEHGVQYTYSTTTKFANFINRTLD